jgi:hypothetical protein
MGPELKDLGYDVFDELAAIILGTHRFNSGSLSFNVQPMKEDVGCVPVYAI